MTKAANRISEFFTDLDRQIAYIDGIESCKREWRTGRKPVCGIPEGTKKQLRKAWWDGYFDQQRKLRGKDHLYQRGCSR